jgi:GNAT superfamily N-acetyltransferase
MIRRTVLRDRDQPGARNIGLIDQVTRYALAAGYHVALDGILRARRYEEMLAGLRRDHDGPSYFYYLDACLDETLRRHETRPQRTEFSAADMRGWYEPRDLLTTIAERVIPQTSTLTETVATITAETRLVTAVTLRAEAAARGDLPSWLELVSQVEAPTGPMAAAFADHAVKALDRNCALVVRDTVLGAALLSHQPGERRIRWLAVRPDARRRGVGSMLLAEILRRWPPPGDVDVATSGAEMPGGAPARAFYESFGFTAAEMLPPEPGCSSRQRYVLRRSSSGPS